MKATICFWLLISLFYFSKDSTSTTPSVSTASYIKMKINGVAWKGEDRFLLGTTENNFLDFFSSSL